MNSEYKTIEEGNILIAIFDGWYQDKTINRGTDINWLHPTKSVKISNKILIPCTATNFKYHSDYESLISVIIKICSLGFTSSLTFCDGYYIFGIIGYNKTGKKFHNKYESDKPNTAMWLTIVLFLTWYNENNS